MNPSTSGSTGQNCKKINSPNLKKCFNRNIRHSVLFFSFKQTYLYHSNIEKSKKGSLTLCKCKLLADGGVRDAIKEKKLTTFNIHMKQKKIQIFTNL